MCSEKSEWTRHYHYLTWSCTLLITTLTHDEESFASDQTSSTQQSKKKCPPPLSPPPMYEEEIDEGVTDGGKIEKNSSHLRRGFDILQLYLLVSHHTDTPFYIPPTSHFIC